ncbi:hypothetical protein SUGI_0718630 [Cryptomeria japonica]|nr:hypothetical protein SUGI_0718630 [Cryptomeria japonica]
MDERAQGQGAARVLDDAAGIGKTTNQMGRQIVWVPLWMMGERAQGRGVARISDDAAEDKEDDDSDGKADRLDSSMVPLVRVLPFVLSSCCLR